MCENGFPHVSQYGTRPPCKSSSGTSIECEYSPVHYTFRVPISSRAVVPNEEIKSQYVKSPPFHLQLDHTLGVIWSLFSKDSKEETPLGIAQLQWALNFLEGIYNENGEHPKDVALCIEAIQEELIQEYAQIADVMKEGEMFTSTPKTSADDVNVETEGESKEDKAKCDVDAGKQPFSVNYEEMSKSLPSRIGQFLTFRKSSVLLSGEEMDLEISKIKETYRECTKTGKKCPLYSKDSLLEFLKTWRREQIDKIQVELKRLQSIESFLGNADNSDFPPVDSILQSCSKTTGKDEAPGE